MATFEKLKYLTDDLHVITRDMRSLEADAGQNYGELEAARPGFLVASAEAFASGEMAARFMHEDQYYGFITTLTRSQHIDPFDRLNTTRHTVSALRKLRAGGSIIALYSLSEPNLHDQSSRSGTWTIGQQSGEPSISVKVDGDVARLAVDVCVEGATGEAITGSIDVSEITEYFMHRNSGHADRIDRPSVATNTYKTQRLVEGILGSQPSAEHFEDYFRYIDYQKGMLEAIVRSSIRLADVQFGSEGLTQLRASALNDISLSIGNYSLGALKLAAIDGNRAAAAVIQREIENMGVEFHVRKKPVARDLAFIMRHLEA